MLPHEQIVFGHNISCQGVLAKSLLILDIRSKVLGPWGESRVHPVKPMKLVKKKPDLLLLLFLLFGLGVVLSAGASLI
jgi:hypothetical protein